ncbi:hypothetical protein KFK09_011571 [Dendrobium nobile]|uniref:Uncharacterized protein n=1 Tax=Dendrobium nobile TaxID=94219 RepID=A0A8T3BGA8_DENNO|nr:hypothetical protein KFK09_011571 [Dendrobium nobile]
MSVVLHQKLEFLFLLMKTCFNGGRREYARICVRIKLEGKLPLGVWVERELGKFYQKVCYEKLPFICFKYGRIGHLEKVYQVSNEEPVQIFNEDVARSVEGDVAVMRKNSKADSVENDVFKATKDDYGPWLHVNYGKKRGKNFRIQNNWSRQTISVKKDKKVQKKSIQKLIEFRTRARQKSEEDFRGSFTTS